MSRRRHSRPPADDAGLHMLAGALVAALLLGLLGALLLVDTLPGVGLVPGYRVWLGGIVVFGVVAAWLGGWLSEWLSQRDLARRRPTPRSSRTRRDGAEKDADDTATDSGVAPAPLPVAWRRVLARRCHHCRRLPEPVRREFESQLHRFMIGRKVTGIEIDVTEELRILVAASAVTLTAGWPGSEWSRLSEVLLYPKDFDEEYGFDAPELAGQAHPWGIVVMSAPSLQTSFQNRADGYHVGIHEFMHLLDMGDGEADGIPVGFGSARIEAWERLWPREENRLLRGQSVLSPYALTNRVEFLAVAAEAFFGIPVALRRSHRELYDILRDYFRQDPAAWEAASGAAAVEEASIPPRRRAKCARRRATR
jgi:MtfA peptidase